MGQAVSAAMLKEVAAAVCGSHDLLSTTQKCISAWQILSTLACLHCRQAGGGVMRMHPGIVCLQRQTPPTSRASILCCCFSSSCLRVISYWSICRTQPGSIMTKKVSTPS